MTLPSVILTDRFQDAVAMAVDLHRYQPRKGTRIPYLCHLLGVSSLVLEGGGSEDQAIAGLLHDAQEDAGGPATLCLIRDKFGEAVADIVEGCSERYNEQKLPWLQRKLEYLSRIPTESASIQLVSSADKIHNARSILTDLNALGDELWGRFSGGRDGTVWYYRSLSDAFSAGTSPLAPVLEKVVTDLESRAGVSGLGVKPSDLCCGNPYAYPLPHSEANT